MILKHQIQFQLIKLKLLLQGIFINKKVYIYSDAIKKYKFISGKITSFSGESITRDRFEYTINITWDEPLSGFDKEYYTWGAYNLKQYKQQIRTQPIFKAGEEIYYRRGSDKEPQWRKTILYTNRLDIVNEFKSDYIPIHNNLFTNVGINLNKH